LIWLKTAWSGKGCLASTLASCQPAKWPWSQYRRTGNHEAPFLHSFVSKMRGENVVPCWV
jgi:hypothetical protein